MCGTLQCDHRAEKLAFWFEALAIINSPTTLRDASGNSHSCHGVLLDVGLDYRDPAMTPDGAACGEDKVKYTYM